MRVRFSSGEAVRVFVFVFVFVGAMAQVVAAQTGFLEKKIEVDGRTHRYVVYVPSTYNGKTPMPAILFLHGIGEKGDDGWKQVAVGLGPAIMLDSAAWNFIVMFPQMPAGKKSNWMQFEALLLGIVENTKKEYSIDDKRLYLTGLSMGGYGTWMLAAKHPDRFAAIAPICGGGIPGDAEKIKDLPIWCFHGDADKSVPLSASQKMIDAVKAAGGDPRFTVYKGVGHNAWDRAYREEKLAEWFLKHSKK